VRSVLFVVLAYLLVELRNVFLEGKRPFSKLPLFLGSFLGERWVESSAHHRMAKQERLTSVLSCEISSSCHKSHSYPERSAAGYYYQAAELDEGSKPWGKKRSDL